MDMLTRPGNLVIEWDALYPRFTQVTRFPVLTRQVSTCHYIISVHDILVHHVQLVLLLSYPGGLEAGNLDHDELTMLGQFEGACDDHLHGRLLIMKYNQAPYGNGSSNILDGSPTCHPGGPNTDTELNI